MLSHELAHQNQFKGRQISDGKGNKVWQAKTAALQRYFESRHNSTESYDAFGVNNQNDLLARWTDFSNWFEGKVQGKEQGPRPAWITDDQMLQKVKAVALKYYTNPSEFPAHAQSAMFELLNAVRAGRIQLLSDKRTFIRFVKSIRPNNVDNYTRYSNELANYKSLADQKEIDAQTFVRFLQSIQQTAAQLPENEFNIAKTKFSKPRAA